MRKLLTLSIILCCSLSMGAQAAETKESLFFTQDELFSIMRANQGFLAPKLDLTKPSADNKPVDRGRRVITLSGILYHGPNDWTIWLNDERVTPKNLPEHVKGLTVKREYIVLRWEDIATQKMINVTLYPHQNYNIDLDLISNGT